MQTISSIPLLGFGTWQLTGKQCYTAVRQALEIGYRHIDTAQIYANHVEVGLAIKDSGIERQDLFVTSKLWRNQMEPDQVKPAMKQALQELHLDYLDLYLIHWPNSQIPVNLTLEPMRQGQNAGLTRNIGVSNFTVTHLIEVKQAGFDILTNQVEFHPTLNQQELYSYCKAENIVMTAYSPLGQGRDLKHTVIQEIAARHSASPAQIILAWIRQKGMIAIPKASSQDRISQNFESLRIQLTEAELHRIDSVEDYDRSINPSFAEF